MEDNVKSSILVAVKEAQDDAVEFLQQLIRIPSVTGQEGEIQGFLAETLKEMGLEVDVFEPDVNVLRQYQGFVEPELSFSGRPNVVGVWRGEGGGRSLLLNGHVDTVPYDETDPWIEGPLSGSLRDGLVWGRGASDMKGGVAAMFMAVSVLKRIGFQPRGDILIETVVDEERTGIGTLACVHRGYKADAGICCETSDLQVMPACIGRMWFTIRITGKPAGISARRESVSAIDKAIKIVQAVEDLEKIRIRELHHPLYPDNRGALPCVVTMLHAGTFPSITPDKAVLRGSMGLMPYEEIEDARRQLEDHLSHIAATDPWLREHQPEISIEDGYLAAGAEIPVDHPIVKAVQQNYQRSTGREPLIEGRLGAADTRFLIHTGETPTVIFGPGVTAQMHANNENVPVDNLITATKVLALTIYEWCTKEQ